MRTIGNLVALGMLCIGTPTWAQTGFAGKWQTTYGPMTLRLVGKNVIGTYLQAGHSCPIKGQAEKGKLVFRYSEPSVRGQGEFRLSADGQSFIGFYREDGSEENHPWVGKRVKSDAPGDVLPQPAGEDARFGGLWDSAFGRLRLIQHGNKVHGIYDFGGGSTITGKIEGKRLVFRYQEPAGVAGQGWFELADRGAHLRGQWHVDGDSHWSQWPGTRIQPRPGRMWLVVLEAHWEHNLSDHEYAFGDMLRAFFARYPHVQIRHRFFRDEAGLRRWCNELAYLAEPTVLVIASHANSRGLATDGKTIGASVLAESLQYAGSLRLLHFSACEAMKGEFAANLVQALSGKAGFALSGYTSSVDWAASAIIEFSYLEFILGRGMSPSRAAQQVKTLLPFAGDRDLPNAAFKSAGFRLMQLGSPS